MEIFFRFLVYAMSVAVSVKYATGYWVVGPVFGLAVVSWDSKNFRNIAALKHVSFFIASTLIYALVYYISELNFHQQSDAMDYFLGAFPLAVVTGSVFLPLAHKMLFAAAWKKVLRVIIFLVVSFYLVTLAALLNDKFNLGMTVNFLGVAIACWQGLYLYLFFWEKN